jgi:hypothetical protein
MGFFRGLSASWPHSEAKEHIHEWSSYMPMMNANTRRQIKTNNPSSTAE